MTKRKPKRKTTKLVWTLSYEPFMIGGDLHRPIGTMVEVEAPVPIGRGYKAYVIKSPRDGSIRIAEARSGGFVGDSLEQVREDVRTGDPKLMKEQVEKGIRDAKTVEVVKSELFWGKSFK